jgi:carbonic anhydrase
MSPSEMPQSEETGETIPAGSVVEHDALREILAANREYVESFGDKAKLVGAPRRRIAILTCMDARMDPARFCGLREGDAHVIRNAGGRASDDAIRSLVVSCKLMGTTDWFVIHHTGCGMQAYTDDQIRHMLGLDHEDEQHAEAPWGHVWRSARTPADIAWMTFGDLKQSIVEDVERIRTHPLVPASVAIYGYIYHIHHGTLEPVAAANEIGAPKVEAGASGA